MYKFEVQVGRDNQCDRALRKLEILIIFWIVYKKECLILYKNQSFSVPANIYGTTKVFLIIEVFVF